MGDSVGYLYDISMRPSVNTLIFEFLFYGIYLILAWTYTSLTLYQRRSEKKLQPSFYPISLLVLFVLATAGTVISAYEVHNLIQQFIAVAYTKIDPAARETKLVNYRAAISALYTTANLVADMILIRRCYHVWGRQLLVVLAPAFLFVVSTALSFGAITLIRIGAAEEYATHDYATVDRGDNLNYVFLGINTFNNVVLTALVAGRIWWLDRTASRLFGTGTRGEGKANRLCAIASMFMESGSLYPVALIICLIIQVKGSPATMDPILLQIVGIAPTLMIVRTALGLSVENIPMLHDPGEEAAAAEFKCAGYRPSGDFYPSDKKILQGRIPGPPSLICSPFTFTAELPVTPSQTTRRYGRVRTNSDAASAQVESSASSVGTSTLAQPRSDRLQGELTVESEPTSVTVAQTASNDRASPRDSLPSYDRSQAQVGRLQPPRPRGVRHPARRPSCLQR